MIQLQETFDSGSINEAQFDFQMRAVNASGGFNATINTLGLTNPWSGVVLGLSQAASTGCSNLGYSCSDSGQAAGQLYAILTAGKITLDGTQTTGVELLIEQLKNSLFSISIE